VANNKLTILRRVAFLEGVSLLVLFFVAMPLKYLAGLPIAVLICGSIHGALFILFCIALERVRRAHGWPLGRAAAVFGSGWLPFGTFVADRWLRRWEQGEPKGSDPFSSRNG